MRKFLFWSDGTKDERSLAEKLLLYVGVAIGFGAASFIVHQSLDRLFFTSLGATTCILFTAPKSKAAAWWRVLLAHTMCAMIGSAVRWFLGPGWVQCAICVTAAITAMDALDIVHPPAAATSLVGFTSEAGWTLAFSPVLSGMSVLVVCAKLTIFALDRIFRKAASTAGAS